MALRYSSQHLHNDLQKPVISTTILNWNRVRLLKRTLDSYVNTVSVPYELFIVDNGSQDGSRELIQQFCATRPGLAPILLEENRGARRSIWDWSAAVVRCCTLAKTTWSTNQDGARPS